MKREKKKRSAVLHGELDQRDIDNERTKSFQDGENDLEKNIQGNKSFFECIQKEVREKPLTVSIAALTFLGGSLFSIIKLVSFIQDKRFIEYFKISSRFLEQDISKTTLISIVALVTQMLFFAVGVCVGFENDNPKRRVFVSFFRAIFMAYIMLCLILLDDLSERQLFESHKNAFIRYWPLWGFLFFNVVFWLIDLIQFCKKRKIEKKTERSKGKAGRSIERVLIVMGTTLILLYMFLLSQVLVTYDKDYYLEKLDGAVVISESQMYAIIYKTDDYVIGEAIEEKNENGVIHYEIHTDQQKLFDTFNFEMKSLDSSKFEIYPSDASAQNTNTATGTVPSTTAPTTTVPNTINLIP